MAWIHLAQKEFQTVIHSKGLWLLVILSILWGYRPTYVGWEQLGPEITAGFVQNAAAVLLPLGVFLLSYRSVIAERASGSLKFLVTLPLSRADILAGKVIGRTTGIGLGVVVIAAALGTVGGARHGLFSPVIFLGTLAVTILYVAVLVSMATAVSAAVKSHVRASAVVFGIFYLGLIILWSSISKLLYTALTGAPVNPYNVPADGLLFLLARLSPVGAYNVATNWILGAGNSAATHEAVLTKLQPGYSNNVLVVEAAFESENIPLYLHEAGGVIILLLWLIVPLGFSYYRFNRGDIE